MTTSSIEGLGEGCRESLREGRDARVAAYLFSGIVIAGFVVYWVVQIQAVREMLALAYG